MNSVLEVKNFLEYSTNKEILYIIVNIIDICNYNCYYCYNILPRTHKILNLEHLYSFVNWCYDNLNKNIEVDILGGEPTIHPDLYSFCHKIKTKYETIQCHITTNFSADISYIKKLLELDLTMNFSWHSLPEDRYNKKFIEKIKLIPKEYFNKKHVANIVMCEPLFALLSLDVFDEIYLLYPKNTCLGLIDHNHLTNNQFIKVKLNFIYSDSLKSEINKRNTQVFENNLQWLSLVYKYNNNIKFYGPLDILTKLELSDFYHYKCYAGINSLAIKFDGTIRQCEDFNNCLKNQLPIGNVNDKSWNKKSFHYVICNTHFCTCPYHTRKEKIF